jgi:hypothetical protein
MDTEDTIMFASPDKTFLIKPSEITWLQKNHPINHAQLMKMLKDGRARIVDEVPSA